MQAESAAVADSFHHIIRANRVIAVFIFPEVNVLDFSPDVADWLRRDGWCSDRSVDVPDWVPATHPAYTILMSFGGLSLFSHDEQFPDDPTAEIDFCTLSPNDKTAATWSRLVGSLVIGIGHGQNQHENVYADAAGMIYGDSLIHDAFYLRGHSLSDCLHNLLTNTRAKPMLRPDQHTVVLYGIIFDASSDELHRY